MAEDKSQNQGNPGAASLKVERALSWVRDLLVILVLPALLWIMKLEVSNAERDLRILQLQGDLDRIEADIQEIKMVADRVQKIEVQLARTEGKLDTTNRLLSEVKDAVRGMGR